ncbi:MAG: sugar porter family MFS transporter [Bacteroidetes bacterium]|uniref:Sugar porter family MFS transporter n=1 Tax=Candidatus Cryptobacteroides intestinavium TaxID=2840766 RepID=A0A9D9ENF8_9BACT|nr:sugar porter family MFS transporter [Candidatus Cryptobacteroides intestinavium]
METFTKKRNSGYVLFMAVVAAIGGILFGYDTAVISGTISSVSGQFSLDTIQQGWYVGCALVGSIIGVLFAGTLSDSIGRKKTMLIAATLFCLSAIFCAASAGFVQLVCFRIIGGMGIGIVSIVSPVYISEVSPADRRGTMVSLYQLAVTIGFLAAYIVNFWIQDAAQSAQYSSGWWRHVMQDEMWRGMLGSMTVPAIMYFIVIFFIPESPRWLIVKGEGGKASAILTRIYSDRAAAETQMSETKASIEGETVSEWKALLQPGILKAVIIGSAIAILGQFMGVNAVLYYGPEIFSDAGLSSGDSMFSQVLVGAVNMLTTVIAVFIIDKVGRKQLIYWGVSGMILSLIMIGLYFLCGEAWGLGNGFLLSFFLFYVFCCAISISAVVFVLLSEMYPNSVRGRAMSVAGLALWIGTYLIGQLTPWLLENLTPAGTFFLFAAMCVPYILIMWKAVPETTGKTLEEIEEYWKK